MTSNFTDNTWKLITMLVSASHRYGHCVCKALTAPSLKNASAFMPVAHKTRSPPKVLKGDPITEKKYLRSCLSDTKHVLHPKHLNFKGDPVTEKGICAIGTARKTCSPTSWARSTGMELRETYAYSNFSNICLQQFFSLQFMIKLVNIFYFF